MSRKTILMSAPLGLGALVLLWAATTNRGEPEPVKPVRPAPKKAAVQRPAPAEAIAVVEPPVGLLPTRTAAPARSGGEYAVIEERIRLMEDKVFALETKKAEITASNQDLERQLVEKQSEANARMMAEARLQQWGHLLGLTDLQRQSLLELCTLWAKQDAVRPPTRETWLKREDDLRGRLSAEQAGKLHDQSSRQSQQLWSFMGQSLGSMVGASRDEMTRFQQTLGDWRADGAMLLPEAYGADWPGLMKEGTSRLQPLLSPEQMAKLNRFQR